MNQSARSADQSVKASIRARPAELECLVQPEQQFPCSYRRWPHEHTPPLPHAHALRPARLHLHRRRGGGILRSRSREERTVSRQRSSAEPAPLRRRYFLHAELLFFYFYFLCVRLENTNKHLLFTSSSPPLLFPVSSFLFIWIQNQDQDGSDLNWIRSELDYFALEQNQEPAPNQERSGARASICARIIPITVRVCPCL